MRRRHGNRHVHQHRRHGERHLNESHRGQGVDGESDAWRQRRLSTHEPQGTDGGEGKMAEETVVEMDCGHGRMGHIFIGVAVGLTLLLYARGRPPTLNSL